MDEIVVGNVEQLYQQTKGHKIYIYGAKSVALRTCKYLEYKGGGIQGYVVSNKYYNPDEIYGIPVYRIEESDIYFDCMVLAVNGAIIWDVKKELMKYSIGKLVIISPLMNNKFYKPSMILSEYCNIADNLCIDNNVQFVADETSSIVVEDGGVIGGGSVLIATDNAHIYVGKNSVIGDNVVISASGKSNVLVNDNVVLDAGSTIAAENNSILRIDDECRLGQVILTIKKDSKIIFSKRCLLGGENDYIVADNNAYIYIGHSSTFMGQLYMVCEKSRILIGEDCMFSFYIKMNVGSHRIVDKNTGEDITNLKGIKIGNHVWCGIGATILPGCIIGDGSIVGAYTIVNKLIPANCTCAGNTARILRKDVEWNRN